ncbi:TPR-like protein [Lophiostoma macrostomum CBS 122681]|uniref:TPR-like protein n=1 Tax=Lophiostoma macrostomum CBS 122681 TaxID=1314788 RepID=A0A6A6T2J2_9PLEO|nr:TPR-like protein [Lophiostoma macrostomum CBS 122681]
MAEALAIVGIVANIAQLIQFGSSVLSRLEEYQSKFGNIPDTFPHIKIELPVLLDALGQTKSAMGAGSIRNESEQALLPAIDGCRAQIRLLDDVIAKVMPGTSSSRLRKSANALRSLRYDVKVERITLVIRGYIQTLTYHAVISTGLSVERTIHRPTPSSTVPFRRDPRFIDRQELAEIERRSRLPASRLALVGLGGVGKSQLAVECSYRLRESSPNTWVFWIHASSTARFREGYQKIAERTQIPGWDQPDVDKLKLVHTWLCDEANGCWLMIIDNADDAEVFMGVTADVTGSQDECPADRAFTLLNYIPQSANGSILFTSRSRDVAFRLTESYDDITKVGPMDQAHALLLLQSQFNGISAKTGVEDDEKFQEDAMALVEALDCMPLAISQAAAYISQRAPRATVSSYLQGLRKGGRGRGKLLQMDLGDTRRDGTASNSIIATWQISFEHIRKERRSATQLLSLMCLFNRQGIPEVLLEGRYHDENDRDADFEDDLAILREYSLIATDTSGCDLQMHRLVQFSTMTWLDLQGELEGWKEKFVTVLEAAFPDPNELSQTSQTLFPHAQAAIACRPTSTGPLLTWASLLRKAQEYSLLIGSYQAAENMGRYALEVRETTLGAEHSDTLESISSIAVVLLSNSKWKRAERMLRRAIKGREGVFGLEESTTLKDIGRLGNALTRLGRFQEAEVTLRQVLEAQQKVPGPEHRDTLLTIGDLGLLLCRMGKNEEAEVNLRRALRGQERLLGSRHPDTLHSMNRLGSLLYKHRKLDEAETILRRGLEGSLVRLGDGHPSTMICAGNLAVVLVDQAKYEEAEPLHRQVLDVLTKTLGEEHPDTIVSYGNVGFVLHRRGFFQEAEVIFRQTLARGEKMLGKKHPATLFSMHNLAICLKSLALDQEAYLLMEQCFQMRNKVLGHFHPDTKDSHEALDRWTEGRCYNVAHEET